MRTLATDATAGTQHDRINVTGSLSLGGTLDVDLINGFTPAAGNSFDILDFNAATLSGTFDAVSLPTLSGGLAWNSSQLYTTGVLSVASAGVPGDYNNNGTVDAADYVLWRNGGPLANEVDNPGTVSAADYTTWRARFGSPGCGAAGASPSPVPEPNVLLLAVLGCVVGVLRRQRGRSQPIKNAQCTRKTLHRPPYKWPNLSVEIGLRPVL